MVRQALRPNQQRAQRSVGISVPAPIGGWDAKSPLAAMPAQNAVILDNWIPRAGYVELRRGYVPQVTGFASPVESLMAYRGGATGDKLFAASAGNLYDVSTQGSTLGAPVFTGANSNRWNYTAFSNAASEWLVACNGVDTPIGYNAGVWAALALTGSSGPITLDPTSLFSVFSHAGRLFYLQADSLFVWNPAAGAVQGACTLLDLSSVFSKGGRLIAGAAWSWQFIGQGPDVYAIFVTDQGQVAVYQGDDPTNASVFSLVGVYDLGPPLGPKALVKFGADLAIVTSDGVLPLSQALRIDRTQSAEVALTAQIFPAFSAAVKAYQGNFGWQGILYPGTSPSDTDGAPGGSLAIFNIPTSTLQASMQFVQNVITGAWCRFLNINAFCWETASQNVYFGAAAGVYQWDVGSSDNGVPIVGDLKSAFSAFGRPGMNKQFTMIRPLMNAPSIVAPALDIDVDYQESEPTATPIVVDASASPVIRFDWTSVGSIGFVGAPRMQVNLVGQPSTGELAYDSGPSDTVAIDGSGDGVLTQGDLPFDVTCQLISFDIVFEPGGVL